MKENKVKKIIARLDRCKIAATLDSNGDITLPDVRLPDYGDRPVTLPAKEMGKLLDEACLVSVSLLETEIFRYVLATLFIMRYPPRPSKN